jgi:hypothetical protein
MQNKEEVKNQMFSHIKKWKSSNQSQKAYCLEHNIRYYVFHYWFKRYRDHQAEKKDNPPSFVKLSITEPVSMAYAELILPDGKRLVFHQRVSSDVLKSLIG